MITSFASEAIASANNRLDAYRTEARRLIRRQSEGTNPIAAASGGDMSGLLGTQNEQLHSEQYRHYAGWAYTAINRIAVRIAGQEVCMGRVRRQGTAMERTYRRSKMPRWTRKSYMDVDIEILESHPLLEAISVPNELMVTWSLLYSTIAALELTGRAYWWMPIEKGRLKIWPMPTHWVTPVHTKKRLFDHYDVRPSGGTDKHTVPPEEIACFPLPHPENPVYDTISPLQAQSMAVSTDEAIQTAQYRSFKNGSFPKLLLKAGRLPGIAGQPGALPVLTPDQRKELIHSIRAVYEGAVNYDEPLIQDGLIEGVDFLDRNPREMDFLRSGSATKSRIFQSFGVNPVIAGEIDNVNRAQAAVAEAIFCANVINPLLMLISQTMTAKLPEDDLLFWIEEAVPNDAELALQQWTLALNTGAASADEYRAEVLNLGPRDEDEEEEEDDEEEDELPEEEPIEDDEEEES